MHNSEKDQQAYLAARDKTPQELVLYVAKKTGRSPFQIGKESRALSKSLGQINLVEYVRNGLFNEEKFSQEARDNFISNDLHWPIVHKCNDQNWVATAEDKCISYCVLRNGGVRVPETIAVIDKTARIYPEVPKISSADELKRVILENSGGSIFGKTIDGMVSFGAFRIDKADEDTIQCSGNEPMSYADFWSGFIGDQSYLIQRNLDNHDEISKYATSLATIRFVNLIHGDRVVCPFAVIKMPQGDNIADAFWRTGNLACDIDVETGKIQTVARRDVEMEFFEDHPTQPDLMGFQLPFWAEAREMNERAAKLFSPIKYQSTDIAITNDGPVVIEINYGGGFDLPQYASGRGFLTPEVRSFFDSCGVDLNDFRKRGFFFGRK